jgi:hypothetical protein
LKGTQRVEISSEVRERVESLLCLERVLIGIDVEVSVNEEELKSYQPLFYISQFHNPTLAYFTVRQWECPTYVNPIRSNSKGLLLEEGYHTKLK